MDNYDVFLLQVAVTLDSIRFDFGCSLKGRGYLVSKKAGSLEFWPL